MIDVDGASGRKAYGFSLADLHQAKLSQALNRCLASAFGNTGQLTQFGKIAGRFLMKQKEQFAP